LLRYRGTVLDVNRNLAETLKLCGPALISYDSVLEQISQTLVSIITKKHVCQAEFDEDEEDLEDEESSEDDWYVIETALDVVTALAAALGEQFGQLWKIFEKPIMAYASGTEASQRSSSVGAIADVIRGMKEGVTPFTGSLLKLLLHRMSDEDSLTKSNAAFAMGLLVEHSTKDADVMKAFNSILTKLEPMLHTEVARQQDNAAGCVSRMISKHGDKMPLQEVLPALVQLLPLKEDYEENEPIFKMIVNLCMLSLSPPYSTKLTNPSDHAQNPVVQSLTPQIMPVLAEVMGPPTEQLDEETRDSLEELVKYIYSKQPAAVQAYPVLMAVIEG
jgi:hypothetical protein